MYVFIYHVHSAHRLYHNLVCVPSLLWRLVVVMPSLLVLANTNAADHSEEYFEHHLQRVYHGLLKQSLEVKFVLCGGYFCI